MTNCPFCARITAGEYDAGDSWSVTFEPLNPVTPGHRLFVPRAHVADALTRPVITGRVMEYAARWATGHNLGPCNLITSAGAEASQTVFHLHLHLVPRCEGDGLPLPWTGQQHTMRVRDGVTELDYPKASMTTITFEHGLAGDRPVVFGEGFEIPIVEGEAPSPLADDDGIDIVDAVLPAMVTPPVVPFPNRWSDGPSLVELDAYGDFAPERSDHDG